MRIGEVIGKVTLSIQDRKLVGGRFLIVRPHDPQSLRDEVLGAGAGEQKARGDKQARVSGSEPTRAAIHTQVGASRGERAESGNEQVRVSGSEPVVAYDELGAHVGQRVGISEGREAAMPFHPDPVAIDAYVACLIDDVTYDEGRGAK